MTSLGRSRRVFGLALSQIKRVIMAPDGRIPNSARIAHTSGIEPLEVTVQIDVLAGVPLLAHHTERAPPVQLGASRTLNLAQNLFLGERRCGDVGEAALVLRAIQDAVEADCVGLAVDVTRVGGPHDGPHAAIVIGLLDSRGLVVRVCLKALLVSGRLVDLVVLWDHHGAVVRVLVEVVLVVAELLEIVVRVVLWGLVSVVLVVHAVGLVVLVGVVALLVVSGAVGGDLVGLDDRAGV